MLLANIHILPNLWFYKLEKVGINERKAKTTWHLCILPVGLIIDVT